MEQWKAALLAGANYISDVWSEPLDWDDEAMAYGTPAIAHNRGSQRWCGRCTGYRDVPGSSHSWHASQMEGRLRSPLGIMMVAPPADGMSKNIYD